MPYLSLALTNRAIATTASTPSEPKQPRLRTRVSSFFRRKASSNTCEDPCSPKPAQVGFEEALAFNSHAFQRAEIGFMDVIVPFVTAGDERVPSGLTGSTNIARSRSTLGTGLISEGREPERPGSYFEWSPDASPRNSGVFLEQWAGRRRRREAQACARPQNLEGQARRRAGTPFGRRKQVERPAEPSRSRSCPALAEMRAPDHAVPAVPSIPSSLMRVAADASSGRRALKRPPRTKRKFSQEGLARFAAQVAEKLAMQEGSERQTHLTPAWEPVVQREAESYFDVALPSPRGELVDLGEVYDSESYGIALYDSTLSLANHLVPSCPATYDRGDPYARKGGEVQSSAWEELFTAPSATCTPPPRAWAPRGSVPESMCDLPEQDTWFTPEPLPCASAEERLDSCALHAYALSQFGTAPVIDHIGPCLCVAAPTEALARIAGNERPSAELSSPSQAGDKERGEDADPEDCSLSSEPGRAMVYRAISAVPCSALVCHTARRPSAQHRIRPFLLSGTAEPARTDACSGRSSPRSPSHQSADQSPRSSGRPTCEAKSSTQQVPARMRQFQHVGVARRLGSDDDDDDDDNNNNSDNRGADEQEPASVKFGVFTPATEPSQPPRTLLQRRGGLRPLVLPLHCEDAEDVRRALSRCTIRTSSAQAERKQAPDSDGGWAPSTPCSPRARSTSPTASLYSASSLSYWSDSIPLAPDTLGPSPRYLDSPFCSPALSPLEVAPSTREPGAWRFSRCVASHANSFQSTPRAEDGHSSENFWHCKGAGTGMAMGTIAGLSPRCACPPSKRQDCQCQCQSIRHDLTRPSSFSPSEDIEAGIRALERSLEVALAAWS